MELKNTFPDLKLRGTEELIFNTFICVQFIFLIIIILYSAEDFFFQTTQDAFLLLFLFHCLLSEPISKHLWEKAYGSGSRRFAVSWACFASRDLCLSRSVEWIA